MLHVHNISNNGLKLKKLIIIIATIFLFGTPALAAPAEYSTYIINNDHEYDGSQDIAIDYTICSDVLENNPTCTAHLSTRILNYTPEKIKFKNESDVLYIWKASKYTFGGRFIESNYSVNTQTSNGTISATSRCKATSKNMIVLNSYDTRERVGCQIVLAS